VLLADHDPISRHVITSLLRADSGTLELLGSVDSFSPVAQWPQLSQAEVVVISVYPQKDSTQTIRELIAGDIRVLLIASSWDRQSLEWALSAGVTGCVVKDAEMGGLVSAVHAVAHGYLLLSPELLDVYRSGARPDRGALAAAPPRSVLTEREYEVLGLLANGMSTTEAARTLGVSPATVKSHVSHSLPKLRVRNRLEAVLVVKSMAQPFPHGAELTG
jgi:DNA-binding NarL/FixJ family response regulator